MTIWLPRECRRRDGSSETIIVLLHKCEFPFYCWFGARGKKGWENVDWKLKQSRESIWLHFLRIYTFSATSQWRTRVSFFAIGVNCVLVSFNSDFISFLSLIWFLFVFVGRKIIGFNTVFSMGLLSFALPNNQFWHIALRRTDYRHLAPSIFDFC